MRHSLISLAAAALAVGFAFGGSPAKAASLPKLDNVSGQSTAVETVRYYRRWGYRPYRYRAPYYAPYSYYAPPRYNYYYGPPYARYYRPYAYWGRPYYGRRYYY